MTVLKAAGHVTLRIFLVIIIYYYYYKEISLLMFVFLQSICKELVIMFMVGQQKLLNILYSIMYKLCRCQQTAVLCSRQKIYILQVSMSQLLVGGWFTDNKDMVVETGSWQPYELHGEECLTLIKKKINVSSYM